MQTPLLAGDGPTQDQHRINRTEDNQVPQQTIITHYQTGLPQVDPIPPPIINPNINIDNSAFPTNPRASISFGSSASAVAGAITPIVVVKPQFLTLWNGLPSAIDGSSGKESRNGINNGLGANKPALPDHESPAEVFTRGGASGALEESHMKRVTVGNNNGEMDILAGLPGAGPMTHPIPKGTHDEQKFDRKEDNTVPQRSIITHDQISSSQNAGLVPSSASDSRRTSFSLWLIFGLLGLVILTLLLLLCLFCCLRNKNMREFNRKRILVGLPPVPQSHHWWSAKHPASSSSGNQEYARSRSGRGTSHSAISPAESQLTSSTAQAVRSETRQSTAGNIDRVETTSSHYASAGYYGGNRNDGFSRNGSSNRADYLSTLDRTSGRINRNNVNKTALPEFHAKISHIQRSNYASLMEFNQPSKKFETQPEYRERAVDVGPIDESQPKSYAEWRRCLIAGGGAVDRKNSLKVTSREQEAGQVEEGVSSYRSITEMYHAAETADQRVREQSQQGRWRSLVSRDSKFLELVQTATSFEEIEQVCSRVEYRTLFTPLKWSQIAQCINEAGLCQEPTSNLQSSHSRSQLNVYVGNVGTDW